MMMDKENIRGLWPLKSAHILLSNSANITSRKGQGVKLKFNEKIFQFNLCIAFPSIFLLLYIISIQKSSIAVFTKKLKLTSI